MPSIHFCLTSQIKDEFHPPHKVPGSNSLTKTGHLPPPKKKQKQEQTTNNERTEKHQQFFFSPKRVRVFQIQFPPISVVDEIEELGVWSAPAFNFDHLEDDLERSQNAEDRFDRLAEDPFLVGLFGTPQGTPPIWSVQTQLSMCQVGICTWWFSAWFPFGTTPKGQQASTNARPIV